MRVIVIGTPAQRRSLRSGLADASPEVVGEFASLAEARQSGMAADAVLTPAPGEPALEAPFAEALTPRELQVLELMAEGLPNKQIAQRLGISDQTVKFHVASITGKLGAANRTEAVRRAVGRGLLTL